MQTILVTGALGFIGSHTSIELLIKGYRLILLDNLENSSISLINKIKYVYSLKKEYENISIDFIKGDVRDSRLLDEIFLLELKKGNTISGVLHFAGLKSTSESVINPIKYWDQNLISTITLLKVMNKFNCKNLVFSSSATVYGASQDNPLNEELICSPINPYGETKNSIEKMLKNVYESDRDNWNIINLRYFNPIGAHTSTLIGQMSNQSDGNLFPILCEVALNKREELIIYGNNWPTKDGTCVRDYVHIMDIAEGHIKSLEYLFSSKGVFHSINLGTGRPTSVMELIKIFEKVNKVNIKFSFSDRRVGDVPILCADVKLAKKILNWNSRLGIEQMCIDGWNWFKNYHN